MEMVSRLGLSNELVWVGMARWMGEERPEMFGFLIRALKRTYGTYGT
jgi:hypothetical protein